MQRRVGDTPSGRRDERLRGMWRVPQTQHQGLWRRRCMWLRQGSTGMRPLDQVQAAGGISGQRARSAGGEGWALENKRRSRVAQRALFPGEDGGRGRALPGLSPGSRSSLGQPLQHRASTPTTSCPAAASPGAAPVPPLLQSREVSTGIKEGS